MSFKISIDNRTEWCDVCGARNIADGINPDLPRLMFSIAQKDPKCDRNMIFAHIDCLERKLAKAKRAHEKESQLMTA